MKVRILRAGEDAVLTRVASGVFDHAIDMRLTREFLGDARHHIAVAIEDGMVVGMVSAIHYVHPDKRAELWINEVGVAPTHRRRGVAKALLSEILEAGRRAGCGEAWVLTDRENMAAMRLYAGIGGEEAARDQVMFTFRMQGTFGDDGGRR